MSSHSTRIEWRRTSADFSLESFSRNHEVKFGTGQQLSLSATHEYRGDAERVNPEELLLAALSSCHMMTFLALAARSGLVVDHYADEAIGYLEKGADGRIWLTRVVLRPDVRFAEQPPPDREHQLALHARAHRGCFIANSVKTEVEVELRAE
jgi:organic hydroperoxide reductase OsmC/OhrA